ncbi:MAG: dihydrolipoyl dehydrogenase [Polyangiaceae bacterium]|jgi:dihydrolipoamide dehydrogenase
MGAQMIPEERAVDVAVVGAGTAGLAAYRAAAALTPEVILIEGGVYGTTCARVGCMPSKLLIAAAEVAHEARHAAPFGLHASVEVDRRAVMDRVLRERDRFVGFVVSSVESIPVNRKLIGYARFVEPGLLEVGATRVRARAVVVATGSTPVLPSMFSGLGDRMIVNDDVFGWSELPDSVVVFGAGVVGLELGQALHRLGVRVRILGKGGRLGVLTDPVVRDAAGRALSSELPLDLDAGTRNVRRVEDRVVVEWVDAAGQVRVESFAFALVAAGRRPNLSGLDLERGGVALDADGFARVDRTTARLGGSNVFLAGDVSNDIPLLHEAADEGRIAGENAAKFPEVRPGVRRSPLSVVFTDPQMTVAGEGYAAVAVRGSEVVIGQVSFEDQGRSRVMLKNYGAARIYAEASSGRFLGAEMAGPRAEHIGHLLAWAHQEQLTIARMLSMPFYHPVVEEGIRTALRDAATKLSAHR